MTTVAKTAYHAHAARNAMISNEATNHTPQPATSTISRRANP